MNYQRKWALIWLDFINNNVIMGAWGIKNFENDTAIDWLNDFQQERDFTAIELVLDGLLNEPDFIDDEESFITLGCLELLAIKQGLINPTIEINTSLHITYNLIQKTIKATHKILFFENHSELRSLWEESEEYAEWQDYQLFLVKILNDYLKTIAPGFEPNDNLPPVDKNNPWLSTDWNKN